MLNGKERGEFTWKLGDEREKERRISIDVLQGWNVAKGSATTRRGKNGGEY